MAPRTSALSPVPATLPAALRASLAPSAFTSRTLFEVVGLQLETVGGESVGLYGVGASPQIIHVDIRDHLRVGEVRAGVGVPKPTPRSPSSVPTAPSPIRMRVPSSSLKFGLKVKTSLLLVTHSRGERLRLLFHLICRSDLRGSWHLPRGLRLAGCRGFSGPSLRRSR